MTYIPILSLEDLGKVPQSTEDVASHVISYSNLASYYFAPNIIYKADDVFIVDSNLNLNATAIAKDANDDRIPADIFFKDIHITATVTPTAPTGKLPVSAGTAELLTKTLLYNFPGVANVTSFPQQQGGMSWLSLSTSNIATVWADHARAFDQSIPSAVMIAGVQNFTGGNGAGTGASNIYYLGASIAGYPLYSASMAFRALGYNVKGLGVALDYTHGFLQIGAGTLTDWYGRNIRIPQNSKQAFYYTHGQTILNSPALAVTATDLHRRDNNGTLIATVANEIVWHFVYLEPNTLNVYIVLWSNPTAFTHNGSGTPNDPAFLVNALHSHSQTTIPDFLRENGILLACIATGTNRTFDAGGSPVFQMHNFTPGNGNSLNPGVPSPQDFPYGGTLKAKNSIYQIIFDYDGYLISQAAMLKNNYLFVYQDSLPHDLDHSPYQSDASAPFTLIGFGSVIQNIDIPYPEVATYHRYSYFDLSTYQDPNEKGNYYGSYLIHTPTANYPEYVQIAEYQGKTAIIELFAGGTKYIPVLINNIYMTRTAAGNTYSFLVGQAKIPGINGGTAAESGIFRYTDALRANRALHGSADSIIIVKASYAGNALTPYQLTYILRYVNPDVAQLFYALVGLIGSNLVAQFKEKFAALQKIGIPFAIRAQTKAIVGYYINYISPTARFEHCLIGDSSILVDSATGAVSIDSDHPIYIQPSDVLGLASADITPEQAVFLFLQLRFNFLGGVFGGPQWEAGEAPLA